MLLVQQSDGPRKRGSACSTHGNRTAGGDPGAQPVPVRGTSSCLMRPRYPSRYHDAADGWRGCPALAPACRLLARRGCCRSCGPGGVSLALGGVGEACQEPPASRSGSRQAGGSVPPREPELRPPSASRSRREVRRHQGCGTRASFPGPRSQPLGVGRVPAAFDEMPMHHTQLFREDASSANSPGCHCRGFN